MSAPYPLDACRAAYVPSGGLAALAPQRTKGGIRVRLGESLWIEWDGNRPEVIAALLAVPGAEFFLPREGRWHRVGCELPAFDVPPPGEAIALERAMFPEALRADSPSSGDLPRVPLRLVRCDILRETRAIRISIQQLTDWAEAAISADIESVEAICCDSFVWVIGNKLPPIADAERYWGERVWVPLGSRPEPDWPESVLLEAANIDADEILVFTESGLEAIPSDKFETLTRGSIRRAR